MTKPILVVLAALMSLGVAFGQSQMSNPYVRPACTATVTTNCTPQVDGGGAYVPVVGAGLGDVVGPAKATDGNLAVFDTTTGKLLKDGGAIPSTTGLVAGAAALTTVGAIPRVSAAGTLGEAASSNVVALWASGKCAGALLADGTCDLLAFQPRNGNRNVTITTDTILESDEGKWITYSNVGAIATTFPCPAGGTFPAGWKAHLKNANLGTVTLTATGGCWIDNVAITSIVLTEGKGAIVESNGTNLFSMRSVGAGTSGGVLYFSDVYTQDSSLLLADGALMVGGGAGAAPETLASDIGVVKLTKGIPGAAASTDLSDTAGLVRGAAALTTDNKVVAVSAIDGTLQEIPNQTANYIYAGPATGAAAAPTFRATVAADVGTLGGIAVLTTGAGAPSAGCAVPSTTNVALYWDSTSLNLYFCSAVTPTWQKLLTDGAGKNKTGATQWGGVTSGGAGFTVNDVAGTSILYILPAANGAAGEMLYDTGPVACPTLETAPTSCHQLAWIGSAFIATASTVALRNASAEVIAANTVATGKTAMATDTAVADAQLAAKYKTWQMSVKIWGTGTGFLLQDTDDELDLWEQALAARTITKATCKSDTGSPTLMLQKDDGSPANMFAAAMTCAPSPSGTDGTTGILTSFEAGEAALAQGVWLDYLTVIAGGAAHSMSITVSGTID